MKVINIEKFKQWLKNEQKKLEKSAQECWEKGNEMDAVEMRVEANIYAFLAYLITSDAEFDRPDFVEEVATEERK